MSHTDSRKEEDNELLEDWTLVEFQDNTQLEEDEQDDDENTEGAVTPPEEEEEVEATEEEVEEEEEGNEGQKVEDIKGDEESSEKKVRKRKVDKTEEKELKEIEASESSEDALQKRTDISTPEDDRNKRLNTIVVAILILVSVFGLFHFIGWSSRSLWEENLNAAQVRTSRELQESITPCVASSPPTDSPSPIVHHDSAFDDLKFDDPLFKDNLVPPSPFKHESYSSAGSLIETFVEPLEDTGIILDASPFIEQQYETLIDTRINSQVENDNGENLLDLHPSKSNGIVDYINAKESLSSIPAESAYKVEMTETQIPESLTITKPSEGLFIKSNDLENLKSNIKKFPEGYKYILEKQFTDPFVVLSADTEDILFSNFLDFNSRKEEQDNENEKSAVISKFTVSSSYGEQFYDDGDNDYYPKKFTDNVITPDTPKVDINMKTVHPNPSSSKINRAEIFDRINKEFPDGDFSSINPSATETDSSNENLDMTEEESENTYTFLKSCINICKDKLNEFYGEVVDKKKKKKISENILESFVHFLRNYIKHLSAIGGNEERIKSFYDFLKTKFYKDRSVLWNDLRIFLCVDDDDDDKNKPILDTCSKEEKFEILSYWIKNICNLETMKLEDYFKHSRIFELCYSLKSYLQKSPCDCNGINTDLQILEKLKLENEELQEKILELQAENTEPFKIKGREGKEGRLLREKINHLVMENEDMRLALSRHQFSVLPDGDKTEFNKAAQENHHFRTTTQQLKHLVPDVNRLEVSLESLKNEHKELLKIVGKIRHEQTIPKELTPLIKQLEEMRSVVAAEAKKKNPPSTLSNARSYIAYMSQVLSAFTFLHEMEEKSAAEKIDLAKDIFTYWMPKGIKVPPKLQDDVVKAKNHFSAVKSSIRKKWKQLKDLTKPETIVEVGQSTVAKMNRVIVNVVNKLKDIGQSTIMSTNKQFEQSVLALSSGLSTLNRQFDETWKSLEIRISMGDRGEEDMEDDDDDGEEEEEGEVDSGYDDEDIDEENDEDEEGDIIEDGSIENDEDDIEETESIEKDIVTDKIKYGKKAEEEKKAPPKHADTRSKPQADTRSKPQTDTRSKPQADTRSKPQADTRSKPQADMQHTSTLENEEIREEIQKQLKNKEFENLRGKSDSKPDHHKDRKIQPKRDDHRQNHKRSVEEKVDHRQKEKSFKDQEPRDHKKDSKNNLKDKIREKKEDQKLIKEDSRYFKGQYNKFDKVKDGADKEVPDFTRKYYRHSEDDDDDDEDDDDDYDSKVPKKATGLKRHWEKPQKKSYFREQSGPKKQFIRRRGKECYWDKYHDKSECNKPVKRWEQTREGKWDDNKIRKKIVRNEYTKMNKPVKQIENSKKSRESKNRRENVKCEKSDHRKKRDQYSKCRDSKADKKHYRFEDENQIQSGVQVKNNGMGRKRKLNWDKIENEKYSNSRNKENKKIKNKKSKAQTDREKKINKGKKIDFKLKSRGFSSR